jgi:hypothetical protein
MIVTRASLAPPDPLVLALPSPPPFAGAAPGAAAPFARWRDEAEAALKRQRLRRFSGEVEIEIVFAAPKRRSDLAARIAPLLLLLVRAGILPASDSTVVRSLRASWGNVAQCELTVRSRA